MIRFRRGLAALALAIAPAIALAQGYPERPITFVVPFAAGGATDTLARQFAERMGRGKASIVVENVAGAGGTVGATRVAKAKADGYTFLIGHVGYMAAAPALYKQLGYDPVQDFDAVARFPDTPLVLVCGKAKPYTASIGSLVEFARQNPGKVNVANAGVGSSGHLVAALVASQYKIDVVHVPYKGNAPALADILGGTVDCLFDQSNTALPQVRGGKVLGVATTARQRLPQLPQVPTLDESGLPGFEAATWYGIYAPKGTPREAIQWMFAQFTETMNDPDFTAKLVDAGYVLLPAEQQRGDALAAHTRKEVALWKNVVTEAKIPPQ